MCHQRAYCTSEFILCISQSVWIGVCLDEAALSECLPLILLSQCSGHHTRGGEERGEGVGYVCGASRCSLIVPGDCSASNCDPPLLYADGAVSSIMDRR